MTKKNKKESGFNKVVKMIDSASGIIEKITNTVKSEIDSLKKRLISLGIAFGLIFVAVLVILLGLGQFLTNRFTLEPGIGAIILGASLLILVLLYLAVKKE